MQAGRATPRDGNMPNKRSPPRSARKRLTVTLRRTTMPLTRGDNQVNTWCRPAQLKEADGHRDRGLHP